MGYSDGNSYEEILDRVLGSDAFINMDRREGSIIYDAVAPFCMELAEAYAKMDILEGQSYIMTAAGTNLDKLAYNYGVVRNAATYAQRIGSFKKYQTDSDGNFVKDEDGNKILVEMRIPEGTRFAVPNDTSTYVYIGSEDGYEVLRCEQGGTAGNTHEGAILPLTPVAGLVEARIVSTLVPGEDTETDEELRQRVRSKLNSRAFGGNIDDYIERVNAIEGVGQTKVFPAWRYNGSVLLSVVDGDYNPITDEFAAKLKQEIDPEERSGEGVGTAPIGHYVTVTTPVRMGVDIGMTIDATAEKSALKEEISEVLEKYVDEVRRGWRQDERLLVLRALIIQRIINEVGHVVNVRDVTINGADDDLVISDEADIGRQYLPYLGEVTVE